MITLELGGVSWFKGRIPWFQNSLLRTRQPMPRYLWPLRALIWRPNHRSTQEVRTVELRTLSRSWISVSLPHQPSRPPPTPYLPTPQQFWHWDSVSNVQYLLSMDQQIPFYQFKYSMILRGELKYIFVTFIRKSFPINP